MWKCENAATRLKSHFLLFSLKLIYQLVMVRLSDFAMVWYHFNDPAKEFLILNY